MFAKNYYDWVEVAYVPKFELNSQNINQIITLHDLSGQNKVKLSRRWQIKASFYER